MNSLSIVKGLLIAAALAGCAGQQDLPRQELARPGWAPVAAPPLPEPLDSNPPGAIYAPKPVPLAPAPAPYYPADDGMPRDAPEAPNASSPSPSASPAPSSTLGEIAMGLGTGITANKITQAAKPVAAMTGATAVGRGAAAEATAAGTAETDAAVAAGRSALARGMTGAAAEFAEAGAAVGFADVLVIGGMAYLAWKAGEAIYDHLHQNSEQPSH